MTDKPTPTDTELKAMWQIHAADIGGIFSYALAVLAKWGQPAQAAEPFCWHWENTFNGGTGTVKKNPETLGINMSHPDYKWTALYTAPQPVEREPLSDDEVDSLCKVGPVYATDGKVTLTPPQYRYALESAQRYGLRKGERAHGIKKRDPHVE